jgi:hypothetical protein
MYKHPTELIQPLLPATMSWICAVNEGANFTMSMVEKCQIVLKPGIDWMLQHEKAVANAGMTGGQQNGNGKVTRASGRQLQNPPGNTEWSREWEDWRSWSIKTLAGDK